MGTNTTAIHHALARGRRTLAKRNSSLVAPALPRPSQSSISLARRFAEALANSDLRAFIDLLAPNATWQMPPLAEWYAVAAFAHAVPMTLCPSWRTRELTANAPAAVAFYVGEHRDGPHEAGL